MTRAKQWLRRRVTLVLSDEMHKQHLITVWGLVREREHNPTSGAFIYEGPLRDIWNYVKAWYPTTVEGRTLVGVLYASDAEVDKGAIGWLKASEDDQEVIHE